MAEITIQELKDKYPMLYRAYKAAVDFRESPEKLLPEFEYLAKLELEKDSEEYKNWQERIAIYAAVFREMAKMTQATTDFYQRAYERAYKK